MIKCQSQKLCLISRNLIETIFTCSIGGFFFFLLNSSKNILFQFFVVFLLTYFQICIFSSEEKSGSGPTVSVSIRLSSRASNVSFRSKSTDVPSSSLSSNSSHSQNFMTCLKSAWQVLPVMPSIAHHSQTQCSSFTVSSKNFFSSSSRRSSRCSDILLC